MERDHERLRARKNIKLPIYGSTPIEPAAAAAETLGTHNAGVSAFLISVPIINASRGKNMDQNRTS